MGTSSFDPRKALQAAGKLVGCAAEPAAGRLAEAVRTMPPSRLDWLMRSPARRVILEAIFWQLPQQLDRERAIGVNLSIRWRITGRADDGVDVYDLIVVEGRARVLREGEGPVPRMTVTVDAAEFLRIATGSSNPVSAYFNGKLSLRGDLLQAARLTMLFRIPAQPRPDARPRTRGRPPGATSPDG